MHTGGSGDDKRPPHDFFKRKYKDFTITHQLISLDFDLNRYNKRIKIYKDDK